ncbi:phosphatidylinositol-specific phospholipase C [Tenacibaculum sp. C7A-26P2]|uniref:phosphatidylinositol-specific phospholipase C n=1 Tax=Tenacibaculum sp. C7A-26P2 TaxID=3447504 RepID=UPI003F854761
MKLYKLLLLFNFCLLMSCSRDDRLIDENTINFHKSEKDKLKEIGSKSYNDEEYTSLNNSKWMSQLFDSVKIEEISIPGTHNTCALYGGSIAECQSMNIQEQLKSGIRFMDIRCRLIDQVFTIHHGVIYQKINFGEVIISLKKFLKENPSETVFIRVKKEYSDDVKDNDFIEVFEKYLDKHGRHNFYVPKSSEEHNIPESLGSVRGKIVIIENVSGLPGIKWNSLKIQDDYKVETLFNIDEKYKKITNHLEASTKDKDNIYLNFTSGNSSYGLALPYFIAGHINEDLLDYLKVNSRIKTGIVAMDYPGDDLIQAIINTNNFIK